MVQSFPQVPVHSEEAGSGAGGSHVDGASGPFP
jgi:hypothetical protein